MKIAHLADAHLDTAFQQFSSNVARLRRKAIETALDKAFREALVVGVDAIFLAGDIYEHERVAPDTGAFLQRLFESASPTPVFVSPGNHDFYGPSSLYARLEWSDNVTVFTSDRLEPIELSDGFTVWGAAHCAPANTDSFLTGFTLDRGGINVALFHGSEQGSFGFQVEGKVPHAPFHGHEIEAVGLDHVFSGHFHAAVDAPRYTYPGNPEPLAFGEQAVPVPGLVVATVGTDGRINRDRISVAQTELHEIDLDLTGCTSSAEIRERAVSVIGGLGGCIRVTVGGEVGSDADVSLDDIRRSAPSATAVVARVRHLTNAYDLELIGGETTVRGAFVRDVQAADLPGEMRERIIVTGLRALAGRDDLEVV